MKIKINTDEILKNTRNILAEMLIPYFPEKIDVDIYDDTVCSRSTESRCKFLSITIFHNPICVLFNEVLDRLNHSVTNEIGLGYTIPCKKCLSLRLENNLK